MGARKAAELGAAQKDVQATRRLDLQRVGLVVRRERVPSNTAAIEPPHNTSIEKSGSWRRAQNPCINCSGRYQNWPQVSIGIRSLASFYARFATKDALLPYLYERYDETLEAAFKARLARVDWDALDARGACAAAVDALTGMYDDRRWLLRALSLFARVRPEALPADVVERRRLVFDPLVEILLRHRRRIRHPDPEAAVRFGIFLVSSVLREKLLFGHAPHARVTPITRPALREELVRTLTAYLTSEVSR